MLSVYKEIVLDIPVLMPGGRETRLAASSALTLCVLSVLVPHRDFEAVDSFVVVLSVDDLSANTIDSHTLTNRLSSDVLANSSSVWVSSDVDCSVVEVAAKGALIKLLEDFQWIRNRGEDTKEEFKVMCTEYILAHYDNKNV